MGDFSQETDDTMDNLGTVSTVYDMFDYVRRLSRGGKGGGFEIPGMTAVNAVLDGYNVINGTGTLIDGIADSDAQTGLEGVHDIIDGGAGLLSNAGGELGVGAAAFGAGYGAGDLIAPLFFDDVGEGDNDGPDEDGVYHPSCGNSVIDSIIELF